MSSKIPLGVYVGNPNDADPNEQAATQAQFESFAQAVGRAPTFMDTYVDYSQDWSSFAGNAAWSAQSWAQSPFLKGVTPVIGLPMATDAQTGDQAFKDIIAGNYDSDFTGVIAAWRDAGYATMYVRPGWEMNGSWSPWFEDDDRQTQADFVAAFRHVADLVHGVSGATVKVVWNPNVTYSDSTSPTDLYPGDKYVDVIGLDQYSPSSPYTGNQFGVPEAQAFATAHGKSFALPETGAGVFTDQGPSASTDAGSAWPAFLQSQLTAPGAPPTAFVDIWDINVPDGDWAFSGSGNLPQEQAGWKALASATVATSNPPPPPLPSGGGSSDTLVVKLSEDAWKGNAKFVVSVDGKQIDQTQTVVALHWKGQVESFTDHGSWGGGQHAVGISFINDAWGGTSSTDRNLYVASLAYDGQQFPHASAALYPDGTKHFTV